MGRRPRVHIQLPRSADHPTPASAASGGTHQGPPAPGRQAPHGPSSAPPRPVAPLSTKTHCSCPQLSTADRQTLHTGASPEPPPPPYQRASPGPAQGAQLRRALQGSCPHGQLLPAMALPPTIASPVCAPRPSTGPSGRHTPTRSEVPLLGGPTGRQGPLATPGHTRVLIRVEQRE